MKIAFSTVAVAALVLTSTWSFAQDGFVPPQAIAPAQKSFDGRAIDIVGMKTGMTVDEVIAALGAAYSPDLVKTEEGTYRIGSEGITVTTIPFVQLAEIGSVIDPNGVQVYFTGPAAGNQAVIIQRSISFKSEERPPLISTTIEALIEKYGPPSDQFDDGFALRMTWAYQDGAQVECQGDWSGDVPCPDAMGPYSFDLAKNDDSMAHFDMVIAASVRANERDRSLTGWMQVSALDPNLQYEAGRADFDALVAEWERVQAAAPVIAAPAL